MVQEDYIHCLTSTHYVVKHTDFSIKPSGDDRAHCYVRLSAEMRNVLVLRMAVAKVKSADMIRLLCSQGRRLYVHQQMTDSPCAQAGGTSTRRADKTAKAKAQTTVASERGHLEQGQDRRERHRREG